MALTVAALRETVARRGRSHAIIGAALAVFAASVVAGLAARGRIAAAVVQRNRLRSMERDVVAFRAAFRDPSLEERAFRLPDSLAVFVSRDARFSIAQRIAERAERLGLTDVRVRFAEADSADLPAAPELSDTRVVVADYTIAVDCRGALAAVLALVNALPAPVALQRFGASRDAAGGGSAEYHLALAVFESQADTAAPAMPSEPASQVAQLVPYAAAPRQSDLAIAAAPAPVLARDPFAGRTTAPVIAATLSRGAQRALPGVTAASASASTRANLPEPAYHVTTTLMAGVRRAALINDQLIYVGESLPDGSRLTSVERDRVVVTDHKGVAHTVAVAREGEE